MDGIDGWLGVRFGVRLGVELRVGSTSTNLATLW